MKNRETIIKDCRAVMDALSDCSAIDSEIFSVGSEIEVVIGLIQRLVDENATRKLDQNGYQKSMKTSLKFIF